MHKVFHRSNSLLIPLIASALLHALAILILFHSDQTSAPSIHARPGGAPSVRVNIVSGSGSIGADSGPGKGGEDSPVSGSNREGALTQSASELLRTIVYPASAREMGMEGSLLVRIQISEEGIVREISTLQSSGYPILDRSAYDGIYRWRFPRTGLESGIELRVNFRLTEGN